MKRVFAAMVAVAVMGGCAGEEWRKESFNRAESDFAKMLRWKEVPGACAAFADASVLDACLAAAATTKEVSVTDVRTRSVVFADDATAATVEGEVDYYMMPSTRVRTVPYVQKWKVVEGKGWRLLTPPPEMN